MHHSPHIADVTRDTLDALVLQRSETVPVLVDFWADWCEPCRMLMPLLAKLADEYQGKFFLAKVNSDAERELAGRYGIRSLPTLKLFRHGAIVDEILGAQPESALRTWIDKHLPRESDLLLEAALSDHAAGRTADAIARLRNAAAQDPGNDRVKAELAHLLFATGDHVAGDAALAGVSAQGRLDAILRPLLARLEFQRIAATAAPLAELQRKVADTPDNCAARYDLSAVLIVRDDYEGALTQLLEIVKRDRKFRDDAGRKGLLNVFQILGDQHALVKKYRGLLATILN